MTLTRSAHGAIVPYPVDALRDGILAFRHSDVACSEKKRKLDNGRVDQEKTNNSKQWGENTSNSVAQVQRKSRSVVKKRKPRASDRNAHMLMMISSETHH